MGSKTGKPDSFGSEGPFFIDEYEDERGKSPFEKWINGLDGTAAAQVNSYIRRLELGNMSNLRPPGDGVFELKIDFGPGYRVYLAFAGKRLILLLGGGTKRRQRTDIENAKRLWKDYLRRAEEG